MRDSGELRGDYFFSFPFFFQNRFPSHSCDRVNEEVVGAGGPRRVSPEFRAALSDFSRYGSPSSVLTRTHRLTFALDTRQKFPVYIFFFLSPLSFSLFFSPFLSFFGRNNGRNISLERQSQRPDFSDRMLPETNCSYFVLLTAARSDRRDRRCSVIETASRALRYKRDRRWCIDLQL